MPTDSVYETKAHTFNLCFGEWLRTLWWTHTKGRRQLCMRKWKNRRAWWVGPLLREVRVFRTVQHPLFSDEDSCCFIFTVFPLVLLFYFASFSNVLPTTLALSGPSSINIIVSSSLHRAQDSQEKSNRMPMLVCTICNTHTISERAYIRQFNSNYLWWKGWLGVCKDLASLSLLF